jgi:hypothetical protein
MDLGYISVAVSRRVAYRYRVPRKASRLSLLSWDSVHNPRRADHGPRCDFEPKHPTHIGADHVGIDAAHHGRKRGLSFSSGHDPSQSSPSPSQSSCSGPSPGSGCPEVRNMSVNRREFIRRMSVVSGLLVTGLVSTWELVQNLPQGGDAGSNSTVIQPPTQPQPPPTTTAQTVTEQQTVTVTKYVSGPSTQQSATSSQTSQQTSQQTTSQTSSTTTSTIQLVPNGYILVAALSALAGKTSAYFKHPSRGLSILVNVAGQWNAFSATARTHLAPSSLGLPRYIVHAMMRLSILTMALCLAVRPQGLSPSGESWFRTTTSTFQHELAAPRGIGDHAP